MVLSYCPIAGKASLVIFSIFMHHKTLSYIEIELTRDRLRSFDFVVRFCSYDFVRYGNYGNVLLPQFIFSSMN